LTTVPAGVQAFFFAADPGTRFALFHPAQGAVERGGILYIHPFAEEMNKSRRMAALQARAFARAGFSVLQFDLYGCGDSSGDFVDARWEIWKRDVAAATRWLADHSRGPLHLWGLRLGATLGLECWSVAPDQFESALVWQPVLQGESFMTQFLRLALAGDVVRESAGGATGTDRVRKLLDDGQAAEVAGYALASALVRDIEQRRLAGWSLPGASVYWLDVRRTGSDTPAPVRRALDAWRAGGALVTYDAVAGDAFWSSYDIIEVPGLITASLALYARESK
jgi:exosortase A-associated hydrolase 2